MRFHLRNNQTHCYKKNLIAAIKKLHQINENWRGYGVFFAIDLFKEAWVGRENFWKMVDLSRKGILSVCNDQNYGRFSRVGSANFAPNSQIMEEKQTKGICNNKCWKYVQKFRKKDISNSQTGKYFIKCLLEQIWWDFYWNKTWFFS